MFLHISHSLIQVAEMRRTLTPSNSPMSSPSKHGDRFIPSRAGANWSINFHRINVSSAPLSYSSKPLNKEVLCLVLPRRTAVCIICSTASYPLLKSCSERASSAPQWQPAVCWVFCIQRFLYGDCMFSPFRKMKNHQVRTEKQRMLRQTMAKVRPCFYCL